MDLKELRKIVKSDPETKDLDIKDVDLNIVYSYLTARDSSKNANYRPVLKLEPYIHVVYVASALKKETLAQERLKKYSDIIDSEVFIQNARLENFHTFDEHRDKAYKYAKKFVDNYPNIEKGMYVHGPYSTGKSYLLSAIAQELMIKKIPVSFIFIPDLVRSIKSDINTGNLEKTINKLKSVPVLILDDLGGEYNSEWFRDEILLPIIQYRLSAKLPIFVSSNLNYAQLAKSMQFSGKGDDRIKVMRVIDRIRDLTESYSLKDKYTID